MMKKGKRLAAGCGAFLHWELGMDMETDGRGWERAGGRRSL